MQISAKRAKLESQRTDATILPCFQGEETKGMVSSIDRALNGVLARTIGEENFEGKLGKTFLFHTHGKIPARRIIVVGLGEKKELDAERLRRASAAALKLAKSVKAKTIAISPPPKNGQQMMSVEEEAYALATGALLANYTFHKYQKEKREEAEKHAPKTWTIIDASSRRTSLAKRGTAQAEQFIEGVILTRNLVNEPALHETPKRLVQEAEKIAKVAPAIKMRVFDEPSLKKMGANALLAVSRGSDEPAFLIHLTYKPVKKAKRRLALVGKGLTFDSGGLSIKPQEGMKTMKIDMAGAATVLGIFTILAKVGSKHEIHGIIPTTENLISGKAIKPGDVVTAMNGKTIEIINTDAEGRVILADAFAYLGKQKGKWDAMIDFATLTGACVVALGEQMAGLFGTDPALNEAILKASKGEGEQIWEMPLTEDYQRLIESQIADVANIGKTRWAGAITAALFLKEFVPKDTPWAHLDIAGPSWEESGEIPYIPKGGTGFGVRSIMRFLSELS
ncbi:leucyl aminopeptidase [Patescibacteria group bacterium]|nr:leucyl aminopeptidase [Patescibacteria group bacterium]